MAIRLIGEDETTAITLHTDGYANDPSFQSERKNLISLAESLPDNAFLHSIAYGPYADFQLMDEMSAKGSGTCFQLTSPKQVYDCVRDTSLNVSRNSVPAVDFKNDADLMAIVGTDGKFVFTSDTNVLVRGINANATYTVFRYTVCSPSVARHYKTNESDLAATMALSRGWLQNRRLNYAKATANGFSGQFVKPHAVALSNSKIAAFAADLDAVLFASKTVDMSTPYLMTGTTVIDILSALRQDGALINVPYIYKNYRRMSVKKQLGTRNADGTITPPNVETVYKEMGDFLEIDGIEVNREQASIQMRFKQSVQLIQNKRMLNEVAGVDLTNLYSYIQFSVVSSGELNLERVKVRFEENSHALETLIALGVVNESDLDSNRECVINLSDYPVTRITGSFEVDATLPSRLARLRIVSSFLETLCKEFKGTDKFTPEQILAMKEVHVEPSMNISMPTTVPYLSITEALKNGIIDTLPTYSVMVGNTHLLSPSDIDSANECFKRHYTVDGTAKLKLTELLSNPSGTVARVVYSSRLKFTAVDGIVTSIYDILMGITDGEIPELGSDVLQVIRNREFEANKTLLLQANRDLKSLMLDTWAEIIPVSFYVGATGRMPEIKNASSIQTFFGKDDLQKDFPDISVSKDDAEATFIVVDNQMIFTISEGKRYISLKPELSE
jgi:hypothetical protein